MKDFVVALGLVLVIEGLIWAMFPGYALKMLQTAAQIPPSSLRTVGAVVMAAGVLVVWLVRG
jgi:uncharacterized protein